MVVTENINLFHKLQAKPALSSIVKLVKQTQESSKKICADEPNIYLKFDMKKCIKVKKMTKFLTLPNDIFLRSSDVLIIRHLKHDPLIALRKFGVGEDLVSNISKVLTLPEFNSECCDNESKFHMSKTFDLLVVEKCLSTYIMKRLNKHYIGTQKHPHFVNFGKNCSKSYTNIFKQCQIKIREGSCFSVLIGNSGMEAIKLLENLKFVLNKIGEYVPGGDANIRSVNLFCAMSPICLPIYHCGGTASEVKIIKMKKEKVINEPEEVTTVEGAKVRVYPSGHVEVITDGTGVFQKTFDATTNAPLSNRARKRALEQSLVKHKEDALKKYNAGLDKQVVELCNANASTAHGMTVGHGEDSENEGSDNEGSDGEGSDGEGSDGEEELSPPPSKKSKKSTSNQKTPKKSKMDYEDEEEVCPSAKKIKLSPKKHPSPKKVATPKKEVSPKKVAISTKKGKTPKKIVDAKDISKPSPKMLRSRTSNKINTVSPKLLRSRDKKQ